jgi:hypothetical protein
VKRKTCHGCSNLKYLNMPMSVMAGCDKLSDGNMVLVPQRFKRDTITFWRVPENCPLPDSEVKKSADKADWRDWVEVEITEIKELNDLTIVGL